MIATATNKPKAKVRGRRRGVRAAGETGGVAASGRRRTFCVVILRRTPYGLDFVGDDVGWAVGAAEEAVGFVVVDDLLGGGIEF